MSFETLLLYPLIEFSLSVQHEYCSQVPRSLEVVLKSVCSSLFASCSFLCQQYRDSVTISVILVARDACRQIDVGRTFDTCHGFVLTEMKYSSNV
jgi:hypothetical protein